ncbi:MAG: fumarylacetoacetate hydrolase family protein [Candidatus Heimdallarchaeota archaeon]
MKIFAFQTKDGVERLGTFWNDIEVFDIVKVGERLPKPKFEVIKNMEELISMGDKSIKKLNKMIKELKELEVNDLEIFTEIKTNAFYPVKEIKFLPPLTNPQKIICLGRNFLEHAKEGGKEPPINPMIWGKFNTAIIGHQDNIILPKISEKVDVEIELVVVIGKEGKHIPEEEALEYVWGYTIGNDVTARDYQYTDKQFTRAKTMDTFAPLGPWIVTSDELTDPQKLELELKVNGNTWQKSHTKHMIFSVAYTIAYLSKSFTFKPGDLIFTGTPSGVGHYQKPPVYLKKGNIITLSIENIGVLSNPVVEEE